MADFRIVDVDTILSKWHDLLKARWPNFPCQTFQGFMHNNSQELVRCKDCAHRGDLYRCPMRTLVMPGQGPGTVEDRTEDEGFCHMGEKNGGAE